MSSPSENNETERKMRKDKKQTRNRDSNRESRNYNNKAAPPLDAMMVPSQENFTHDVSLPFA